VYPKGREGFLAGDIDWDAHDIRVILVDTGQYAFNAIHDNLDDISVGARVATSSAGLTGKTVVDGVADADDITILSVSGATVEAVVLYRDTGTESTSRLIAYIDTATGLPFTPSGGDVTIVWSNNADRIFRL
jgi:hypothetical protein